MKMIYKQLMTALDEMQVSRRSRPKAKNLIRIFHNAVMHVEDENAR